MVVGAFPIAKLGVLLLKQLSKPIANYAKERAKSHPTFRRYVCIPPARFYNWCEIRTRMWLLNLGKPVNIPPMNEAMAIELGANLLGEGILFVIAAALLMFEYTRQSAKQDQKERKQAEETENLQALITEMMMRQERQDTQIRELFRHVYSLDSRVVKVPWLSKENPYSDENVPVENLPKLSVVSDQSVITEALSYIQDSVYRRQVVDCAQRY